MLQAPKDVQVGLNLGVVQLSGTWEPNDTERLAAWELYVELLTRISVAPLAQDHGLLREALTSLYSLFGTTRQILRTHGPDIAEPKRDGEYSFGFLAVVMLNFSLRPLLAQWHPELEDWESQRRNGSPGGSTSSSGQTPSGCGKPSRPPVRNSPRSTSFWPAPAASRTFAMRCRAATRLDPAGAPHVRSLAPLTCASRGLRR